MECKICHSVDDLREGVCWHCAEAESIIADGTDMYDKGLNSDKRSEFNGNRGTRAVTAMQKLQLLIEKGWINKHKHNA